MKEIFGKFLALSLILVLAFSMVAFDGQAGTSYARVIISDSAPEATGVDYLFEFEFQETFDGNTFSGEVTFTFDEDFGTNEGEITDVPVGCSIDGLEVTCTDLSAEDSVTFTVTNPEKDEEEVGVADTYTVQLDADTGEWGNAMFAIIEPVTVTARVSALLSFTVEGVNANEELHGVAEATDIETQADAINFGTLEDGVPLIGAQDLTISTNASEGYSVSVFQDQDLTSPGGDTISSFLNGESTPTSGALAWTNPDGDLDTPATWGHFGFTTQDVQVAESCISVPETGDPYFDIDSNVWAGFNGSDTEEIMCHTGPSDGEATHIGTTRVGYQIEISTLQPAGEYTNTLTYIATPTF